MQDNKRVLVTAPSNKVSTAAKRCCGCILAVMCTCLISSPFVSSKAVQLLAEKFKMDLEADGKTSASISMISAEDKVFYICVYIQRPYGLTFRIGVQANFAVLCALLTDGEQPISA